MSWLLTVWLLAIVATCCLQTGYVWSGLKEGSAATIIASFSRPRLLVESFRIAFPRNWVTSRMYLLGPLGTAAVLLTFPPERRMPALALFASGLLSALSIWLCLAWMIALTGQESLPWGLLTVAFILLAINVLLTVEHLTTFQRASR